MSTATTVTRISPKLVVADMDAAVAFYQTVLGFAVDLHSAEYSVVVRDGQTIHLTQSASAEIMAWASRHNEIYIQVRGIRALWQHVKTFSSQYRIRDLFERDYGMTEFHIDDGNCLIFVGEPTKDVTAAV